MLRAVFLDMDDTFVAPDKTVPADNLRVLDLALEKGVQVVPCTGRNLAGLPPELASHPSVRYAVCGGGALVYDLGAGGVVSASVIAADAVRSLYDDLRARTAQPFFARRGAEFAAAEQRGDPLRRARAQIMDFHAHGFFSDSKRMVTGPSFSCAICISAPNTPRRTGTERSRSASAACR